MFEKLSTVTISGHKVPIRCDINVLAAVQEEFMTVSAFQQKLIGMIPKKDKNGKTIINSEGSIEYSVGEPSYKAIAFALPLMILEGVAQAEAQGESVEFEWRQPLMDADFELIQTALDMNEEFNRCFSRKKKTSSKDISRSRKMTK